MTNAAEATSERRAYNAVTDFVDRNVEAGLADKVAFIDPARTLTYGALQAATIRFAHGLTALGLRQESRVLLLMLDTVDFPVAFWGAIRAGVVPIPLNTMLTPEQYAVCRQKGTERAFTGAYWNNHEAGTYRCAACGRPLFSSDTKFDSGTGWPSFYAPAEPEGVRSELDTSHGMRRTEVVCAANHAFLCGAAETSGSDTGDIVLEPGAGRCCIRIAAPHRSQEASSE